MTDATAWYTEVKFNFNSLTHRKNVILSQMREQTWIVTPQDADSGN